MLVSRDGTRFVAAARLASGILFALLVALPLAARDQAERADILRHDEDLVRSAHAVVRVTYSATDPHALDDIKAVCAARGRADDWVSYNRSQETASAYSHTYEWWRKGEKERQNRLWDDESSEAYREDGFQGATAFDGNVVRSFSRKDDGVNGYIDSAEGAAWFITVNHEPFNFLYELHKAEPYSSLIKETREYRERTVVRDGKQYNEVEFVHPARDYDKFVLVFDGQDRLVERQWLRRWDGRGDKTYKPQERHVFSDYKLFTLPDGNTVWFPQKGVIHFYVGALDDGTPVEYSTMSFEVVSIEFNVEIPDDVFQLEFPPGTMIWNGLTGVGAVTKNESLERAIAAQLDNMIPQIFEQESVERPDAFADNTGETPVASPVPLEKEERVFDSVRYILALMVLAVLGAVALTCLRSRKRKKASGQ